jgi:hypothetical protein
MTDLTGGAEPRGEATPDNAAAIDFLKKVYPEGPWLLTAVEPDRSAIDTRTFRLATEDKCLEWLKRFNGKRNLYWHVNPILRDLDKKAHREDIKEVCYLHVDVDPRAGEDLAEERKRIEALFTNKLPEGVPAPSLWLFSGGGYQAFWKLETPIPIDGDLPKAEDAKRYNQQLELLFGGDNCHNIDRLMRLPGTINIPDANKLRKGRKPALSTLMNGSGTSYPKSAFAQAPEQLNSSRGTTAIQVDNTKITALSDDLHELDKFELPIWVKTACRQGNDPTYNKPGDKSRSGWGRSVMVAMAGAKVPADTVISIFEDTRFPIGKYLQEKKSNTRKAVLREVERAAEWAADSFKQAVDELVFEMNEKFFAVETYGSKFWIGEFEVNEHGHRKIALQSRANFVHRHEY